MATSPRVPMTVQDILDEIYTNVDDDPTSSVTADDEQTSRIRLINMAIQTWGRKDVYWRELWKKYTHGSALTTATTYVISATDFLQPGSLLYLTDASNNVQFLDVISPEQQLKYVQPASAAGTITTTRPAAFITGNPATGWTINLTFSPQPGDGYYGTTPSLYYYKSPLKMGATTDTPEMSDPSFITWYVTYQKHLFNSRTDQAADAMTQSQEAMQNMQIRNEMMVQYGNLEVEDADVVRYGDILGE